MSLDFIKSFTLAGGEWVIYFLMGCSVLAVAVIIERAVLLTREGRRFRNLREGILKHLNLDRGPSRPKAAETADIAAQIDSVTKIVRRHPGSANRILEAGLSSLDRGRLSVEDRVVAAGLDERRYLETRLLVLGTLGNNAPFIGLFGTVLGVIRAFHDLAQHSTAAGPEVVMRGLSEALIATAVGLFVAIPCVISYNYFQKKVQNLLSGTESLSRMILSRVLATETAQFKHKNSS